MREARELNEYRHFELACNYGTDDPLVLLSVSLITHNLHNKGMLILMHMVVCICTVHLTLESFVFLFLP